MAAAVQKHEENAIKLAEVASELSKPPNLRSDSSTDSVPQSSQKSNILASALFTRKGKDKKKSSNKSKKDQKLDHLKREVQQAKQSEEAELQNSESAEAVTEPGTNDDQVIDIADDLLKQLDEKEEATPTPQSKDAEPAAAAATGAGPEISKVPSARSTSTSTSASTTSADSGVSDSTARSSGTSRLSNLFSKKGRQKARVERREAKMQAEREAAQREVDAANGRNGGDPVEWERQSLMSICRSLNVEMVEMNPDGHCLYAAVAHQLNLQPSRYMKPDNKESVQSVRSAVAKQMRENPDDFIAFIPSEDGLMTPEQFDKYCDTIENTAEWGGQPEIVAVANYYKVPVIVYQAGSPPLKLGEEHIKKLPLRLSYHRRMYGLGEHYNSLRRRPETIAMPVPIG